MVVAGAADVLVHQHGRLLRHGPSLLAVVEDGGDRAVGAGPQHERPGAGGIDPLGAVAVSLADESWFSRTFDPAGEISKRLGDGSVVRSGSAWWEPERRRLP